MLSPFTFKATDSLEQSESLLKIFYFWMKFKKKIDYFYSIFLFDSCLFKALSSNFSFSKNGSIKFEFTKLVEFDSSVYDSMVDSFISM